MSVWHTPSPETFNALVRIYQTCVLARLSLATPVFSTGDDRVNEQVMLTLMHTVWVREHNRVAKLLEAQNPSWPDNLLFQEARRIVVAEMQHIVYNEFLPGVLGEARLSFYWQKRWRLNTAIKKWVGRNRKMQYKGNKRWGSIDTKESEGQEIKKEK